MKTIKEILKSGKFHGSKGRAFYEEKDVKKIIKIFKQGMTEKERKELNFRKWRIIDEIHSYISVALIIALLLFTLGCMTIIVKWIIFK